MLYDPLSYREVGHYPISIGTSLAIESICGTHETQNVGKIVAAEYDMLWLNIRTLLRNLIGASKGVSPLPAPEEFATALVQEIETITNIIKEATTGRCKIMTYYSNYSQIESKHKGALMRVNNTVKQKDNFKFARETLLKVFHEIKARQIPFIGINDLIENQPPSNNLILTNYAYDLLANSSTFKLTLLESHTGMVKSRALWYTKYYEGKSLGMIPFNRLFLQVFGDKETFRPMDIKLRREIIEVATKYKWNSSTSQSMINYGISQLKNSYAIDFLRSLAH